MAARHRSIHKYQQIIACKSSKYEVLFKYFWEVYCYYNNFKICLWSTEDVHIRLQRINLATERILLKLLY